MGSVFKKTYTKPLPQGAELFTRKGQRLARWKDSRGRMRMAPVTVPDRGEWAGQERLLIETGVYYCRFRDHTGLVIEQPTGCRDETAARRVLGELERRNELVRSGILTTAEDRQSLHQGRPLAEHFDAYGEHLQALSLTPKHRKEVRYYLDRIAAECPFGRLADLTRETLERWLASRTAEGMSARLRNAFRENIVAFANWCVSSDRLTVNPFTGIPKANVKADPRRQRRSMEESELVRLFDVARRRPLLEALTIRRGQRKGETLAKVKPAIRERLQLVGRERALIYKTLVLTGLRKGELASLTVGQLHLDGPVAFAVLDAADEKNREGNEIALRADLAADLTEWLGSKLERFQSEARAVGGPIPARLPADALVFNVPVKLYRVLDADLRLAGIAKRDERGRSLDVHALRTTFGTLMSKSGVAPRTAQAAMRHSTIDLTMNVYTDPALLDVHAAVEALPALPLDGPTADAARATGTDAPACTAACWNEYKPGQTGAIPDNTAGEGTETAEKGTLAATSTAGKRNNPLTKSVSGLSVYPQGDSNPCLLAENQTSWATRRWGPSFFV